MKKCVVVIPHSHAWLWVQTCISCLKRFPPTCQDEEIEFQIIVVDNSWNWSPAIRGITDTELGHGVLVVNNQKHNAFHASALDYVVENFEFDYFMALETDVCVLRPGWFGWFRSHMRDDVSAVGHWHHERFVNPSCTLYRGSVLRDMLAWCKSNQNPLDLRWGPSFAEVGHMDQYERWKARTEANREPIFRELAGWVSGPFADKRGWPEGTQLKEEPSGQCKGPGWYEPGQMLHHWSVEAGWKYVIVPNATTQDASRNNCPVGTFYGMNPPGPDPGFSLGQMWNMAYAVHLWGGTRALDIVKHAVNDNFVRSMTPFWLEREGRFWLEAVPPNVQEQTIKLIKQYRWHITGQGNDHVTERDYAAQAEIETYYRNAGVPL